jgi:hypothetical protein
VCHGILSKRARVAAVAEAVPIRSERAGAPQSTRWTGEALAEEFDGRILNPGGVLMDLPFWVFKRLKKLNLLERDRETGRRIRAGVFGLMDLWDGPDFRHDRPVRGFDPGYDRSQSPDSG